MRVIQSKVTWKITALLLLAAVIVSATFLFSGEVFSLTSGSEKNVLLISIDGFRPEFYLENRFQTPTLKSLRNKGVSSQGVVAVYPTLTYPNHTTLITGTYPGRHGIISNSLFTWEKGPEPAWYWEAEHIKVPTIHQRAQAAGMETGSVRWPVTLFADITHNIPEIFEMKPYYEGKGFDLTVKYTKKELIDDVLKNTTLKRYEKEAEMDFWVAESAAYILKSRKPRVMTVHLANVDHIEHKHGREAPEVNAAIRDADKNVKIILSAVDTKSTCVIVSGDHGFFNISQSIRPNLLFIQRGWITLNEGEIADWKVIAQTGGGSAAIYVKDKSLIPEVLKLLRENEKLGYTVVDRSKLDKLGSYPEAVAALDGKPGFAISGATDGEVVSESKVKGNHGFLPEHKQLQTGFLALGCGEKAGLRLGVIQMIDIAPTMARVLGLKLDGFDGKPLNLVSAKPVK
jgi:predicted AlkP superfamily pyrophosphatase or phosphodiesterase